MTHDEAVAEIKSYQRSIDALFAIATLAGIMFTEIGPEVERGLGLPEGA